jgi:nitrate reductase delta subunit
MTPEFLMLAPFKKSQDRLESAQRVKQWTRERFLLAGEATLLVSEVESAVPGFPPLHTVVAFWTAERKHYHFRVFKPLQEVTEEDLPPAWLKDTLEFQPGSDCGCC